MNIVFVHPGEKPPTPARRTRESMPKTRTGCITCKIRHIKCDEERPNCLRCISSKRLCGGYPAPKLSKAALRNSRSCSGSSSNSQTPERQLIQLPGSPRERRAIEFFFHRTAPQLSGLFSQSFWGYFVLQLSTCEPAIRHALIAVSTIHEATEETEVVAPYSVEPIAIHDEKAKFAFVSYNNAIHSLIEEVCRSHEEESLRVLLTACLIIICAELMRGNVAGGITHMESGVKIIQNWRARRIHSPKRSLEVDYIETQLVPYFAALNVISSLFGRPSNGIYSIPNDEAQSIHTFEFRDKIEARTALFDILNAGLTFIQSIGEARYWIQLTEEQKLEQRRLNNLVSEWNVAFQDLAGRCTPSDTPIEVGCTYLLRIIYLTTKLWLSTSLTANETEWDKHKDDYQTLLDLSEYLIKFLTKPEKHGLAFSFELCCIPGLHFMAYKCRWPLLRRRALALLYNCSRRECLFDSRFSFSIFWRIMQVEEESLGLPLGQEPGPDDLPPEEARIHQMNISPELPGMRGIPINLLSKPDGLLGEWYVRREYVQVCKPDMYKSTFLLPLNDLSEAIKHNFPNDYTDTSGPVWVKKSHTSVNMSTGDRRLENPCGINIPTSEMPVGSAIHSAGVFYAHCTIDD